MTLSRRLANADWISLALTPVAVILMEVFWFYPWLVWMGKWRVFAGDRPPLGLVSVLVMIAGAFIVTRYLLGRQWPDGWIRFGVVASALLLAYAVIRTEFHGGYGLLDGDWFGYAGSRILDAFDEADRLMVAMPAAAYLWWRGIVHGREPASVGDIYRTFLFGIGAFVLLVVVWRANQGVGSLDDLASTVAPQVAAFFFFGLAAMALTNLKGIQQRMPREESIGAFNRRWLPTLMVIAGAIVLVGLAVAGAFSPEFVAFLRRVLDTAVEVVRQAIYYILVPFGYIAAAIIWVGLWLRDLIRGDDIPFFEIDVPSGVGKSEAEEIPPGNPIPETLVMILKWALFVAVALVIVFFLAKAVSRFRASRRGAEAGDIDESLWSWQGFKEDVWLLLSAALDRFRRKRRVAAGATIPEWFLEEDPAGRLDIREIYRRLLWQAGRYGSGKRDHETPHEYERRLGPTLPDGSRQLSELTGLYVSVRYGDEDAPSPVIDRANGLWAILRGVLRRPEDRPRLESGRGISGGR